MLTARWAHTATLLTNGKVLVAGGWGSNGRLASAELYDQAANEGLGAWSGAGSMGAARAFHTATLLPNGTVLVAGGYGSSGHLDSAELYDPAANGGLGAWSGGGSMGAVRTQHTATLLSNGKVLVAGGQTGSGYLDSAELYNPAGLNPGLLELLLLEQD